MTERVDLVIAGPVLGPIESSIMRRDRHSQPFDLEADEAVDVTREFWGSSRGWVSREHPTVDGDSVADESPDDLWRDDTTGSMAAIRDGVRAFRPQRIARHDPTGQVQRTRQHGVIGRRPAPHAPSTRDASLGELASGWPGDDEPARDDFDQFGSETEMVPLSPVHPLAERIGLGAVDPLLVRIGMVLLIGALLVPFALALRPTAADTIGAGTPDVPAALVIADDSSAASTGSVPDQTASAAAAAPEPTAPDPVEAVATSGGETVDSAASESSADVTATPPSSADDTGAVGDVAQSTATSGTDAASVSAAAERVVPECPTTYVAGPGDSWYRIADAAGVTPSALLDENRATARTVILPGDDVCLPAGATMPVQPTTTTAATATTQAPTTTPPTTAPATTLAPAPAAPASSSEVQQMIRDIWPDELEEKALQVAWRESNYKPQVFNGSCCYGVFQIYWSVHVSWLDDYGINSSSDLLDARKNITAAYALYQRAGGWGPWGG